jgi:hypothetical protein
MFTFYKTNFLLEIHQTLAILFNLITVICYTINSYSNHQTAFKTNAETSMITKFLLTLHLLGHLIAWITIRQYLNEFTYISITISILICLSAIKFGNNLNAFLPCWITPASFLTYNSSKLLFQNVSTLQRNILLVITFIATALLQLVHLSSIALMMKLTDVFEPSTNITVAR